MADELSKLERWERVVRQFENRVVDEEAVARRAMKIGLEFLWSYKNGVPDASEAANALASLEAFNDWRAKIASSERDGGRARIALALMVLLSREIVFECAETWDAEKTASMIKAVHLVMRSIFTTVYLENQMKTDRQFSEWMGAMRP